VFRDDQGDAIDEGLALFFAAPNSYTGEDVLELHGHGGPVVLQALLKRCVALGARVAEPGEFTKRAFLNDKLDLAQAEGVADLINAATVQAARCAVRSLQGVFSARIAELGAALIDLRMWVEASLDFPEEEIDRLQEAEVRRKLAAISERLASVANAARQGSLLREGIHVVLVGRPNVGKSSLLNALAGEELAIVTEIPGTTRDTIRQAVDVGGIPMHIIDTAGLRDTQDPVERIGVTRTWAAVEKADLVVLLTDCRSGESAEDQEIMSRLPERLPRLRVMNKIDLIAEAPRIATVGNDPAVWLSAKSGAGTELLQQKILEMIGWGAPGEGLFLARARHLEALAKAAGHLQAAGAVGQQVEIFAEELRLAQEALMSVTGEYTSDDLLGEIFSRFCIGK
jgi:tRNA modification GTPase